ncbi:MAG: aminotransferase class I/II-fold pyridoxal phosphate-dependent enzyme [Deltaproteobacteria bacterium]
MILETESLALLGEALDRLESSFSGMPPFDPAIDVPALKSVILEVASRMRDNYPYPHPLYIGHMIKPPHPVARLAYMLSLWINPNNHSLDGGRCSSAMEKEAVGEIAEMFGWKTHLGHLCGGGTMANLEALWVSGALNPGKKIAASQQAHFTHERLCGALGIPFRAIPCDDRARMDSRLLKDALEEDEIGTVVVTIGTTATGSVDPLAEVLELQERHGFRIHADAAYGGYFRLVDNLEAGTRQAYERLGEVDSIVVDPHKHGLQPYGCGSVLFRDPSVGRLYRHDSPYTYFTSSELHLGEISLECSRPGASAVALWATQRLLPLISGGTFAGDLGKSRKAALALYERIKNDSRLVVPFAPELDIVVWTVQADTVSAASELAHKLFEEAASRNLHMAMTNLPASLFADHWDADARDKNTVTCLRSCLMKPEHLEWMDRIWDTFETAAERVLGRP